MSFLSFLSLSVSSEAGRNHSGPAFDDTNDCTKHDKATKKKARPKSQRRRQQDRVEHEEIEEPSMLFGDPDAGASINESMSYDDLVEGFEAHEIERVQLIESCANKDKELEQLRKENSKLKNDLNGANQNIQNLQHAIIVGSRTTAAATAEARKSAVNGGGPVTPFRKHLIQERTKTNEELAKKDREIISLSEKITSMKTISKKLEDRIESEQAKGQLLESRLTSVSQKNVDLTLDNEYLKCVYVAAESHKETTVPNASSTAILPATPFVLVLVDGDSYKWAPELYTTEHDDESSPGAMAARNLKVEVLSYMASKQEQIPPQSRIVTRVFCNKTGLIRSQARVKAHGRGVSVMEEFMTKFTQSTPMFDFFDAGFGKERADAKIQETFHLFIGNPHCHAIFFAACIDNGFARLLEQYNTHPVARQKIILVSPGFLAFEIDSLKLRTVEWPSVFARQFPPHEYAYRKKVNEVLYDGKGVDLKSTRERREGELKFGKAEYARILVERGVAAKAVDLVDKLALGPALRSLHASVSLNGQQEEEKDVKKTGVGPVGLRVDEGVD